MTLDLRSIEPTVVPHFKGGAGEALVRTVFSDEMGRVVSLTLPVGASIGLHTHEGNSEIVFILEGKGKMLCDGRYEELSAGSCTYCPEGHEHSLINDSKGDLIFYAVVPEHHN